MNSLFYTSLLCLVVYYLLSFVSYGSAFLLFVLTLILMVGAIFLESNQKLEPKKISKTIISKYAFIFKGEPSLLNSGCSLFLVTK